MTVRLYRVHAGHDATRLAVADPKSTIRVLTEDQARAKQGALLGEARTDEAGAFSIELSSEQQYDGEAFELDVLAATVPGRRASLPPAKPIQFTITTIQPQWRDRDKYQLAAWSYTIPARFWCLIRSLFDAWTLCGRVTVCDTKLPAAGVLVSAFDRDWLKDDPLGSAFTDGAGRYRIDYSGADFRKGTWLDVELVGGPDVYFHVDTASGGTLLHEPESRGRTKGRENVGPCTCIDLCVAEAPIVRHAWFTRVGDFNIYSDISPSTGLTLSAQPAGFPGAHGGPGYGFWGNLKLIGDCPTLHPLGTQRMRYRFLTRPAGSGATPAPVTAASIAAIKVGSRPVQWNYGAGVQMYPQDIVVAPSGGYTGAQPAPWPSAPPGPPAGPWGSLPPYVLTPDADGWVEMPTDTTNQGFSGPLLLLVSSTLVPAGAPPHDGVGNAVSPANQRNGIDLEIIFEAAPLKTEPPGPLLWNSLPRIHINNWLEVALLELAQLTAPGATPCSGITTAVDIRYTVDHELIAAWNIGLITSAPIAIPVLPGLGVPAVPPDFVDARGGHGTHHIDTTLWPECAYGITFARRLKLTDGEIDDGGRAPLVAMFCTRKP